MGTVCIMT